LRVLATTNVYTEKEDLSPADVIVSCLGDPDGEKAVLRKGPADVVSDGLVHVKAMVEVFSG